MLLNGRGMNCIWFGLVLLACMVGPIGCSKQPDKEEVNRYIKEVETSRTMKDNQFRNGRNSPLTAEQRQHFGQLNYFPVDLKYRVSARYVHNPSPESFAIQTSSGKERAYVRVGRLEFQIAGENYTLMAYQAEKEVGNKEAGEHLFVPFTDSLSGSQSYGGGRYLDIAMPKGESVIVDFNFAYNPYCAYNYRYSCPIPPPENHLPVPIPAGEKTFK